MNISKFSDNKTAKTNITTAKQRAEFFNSLGIKSVIELCVGPSLKYLENEYSKYNIETFGNDIDKRWKEYYRNGKWIIGDCFNITIPNVDAIVFAPPLSIGCSGKREDSLSIDNVFPRYDDFLKVYQGYNKLKVCVLPGRTLSTKEDRKQYYKFIAGKDIILEKKNRWKGYQIL